MHNVYIGQSCTPVSKIPPMWDTGVYFVAYVGYTVNIPKMYPSVHWTLGYIFEKITDLEFEVHKNIFLYEFLAIEQAGTNICWMGYQDRNFKICLSLFGCEELKLPKQHIVHWRIPMSSSEIWFSQMKDSHAMIPKEAWCGAKNEIGVFPIRHQNYLYLCTNKHFLRILNK